MADTAKTFPLSSHDFPYWLWNPITILCSSQSSRKPWCAKSHRTPTERKWYEVNESIYNPLKINTLASPVFPGISTNRFDCLQNRFFELFS